MPYTPPSHRSPASSASTSPDVSRRSSIASSGPRSPLPRSASYLNKHRRTPSATHSTDASIGSLTPQGTSEDLPALAATAPKVVSASVRQSPPPRTDDNGMPKGAMISPPDSASSGSDDESSTLEMRGRNLDKLKDLREAICQIPQARAQSPSAADGSTRAGPPTLQLTSRGMHLSLSTSALGDLEHGRRSSHVRSATEPHASILDTSITNSEDDTDEDLKKKPQMVRKKSGELVRPALRPPSRRRPSSMPGTPVFSGKAVHFDSHLEHVRHFLQLDRPLAVSAGTSPADSYDSDNEYPFPSGDKRQGSRSPPFEWEIITPNFPLEAAYRKTQPVRLEKVWLSQDQKSLLGYVAVANLAFHKQIICRFTLDYWKTTSEVSAEYAHEIRPQDAPMAYDRFTFSIKLADTANLESKTLFLCVRYLVNGQEYWDNNSSANFQVDFRKKHLPQNGKNNFQGVGGKPRNGLPRSRKNNSTSPRPTSMPTTLDDFGNDPRFNFDQPIHEYLGESMPTSLRLKSKSSNNVASDNIVKSLSSPSGAAFSNRYDFSASLSAAVQAAKDKDKDTLYMKNNQRPPRSTPKSNVSTASTTKTVNNDQHVPGTSSPVPSLPSASYEELVNKYCFFGSKQSSPVISDGTLRNGQVDGSAGHSASGSGYDNTGLPRQVPNTRPATNPYFLIDTPEAFPTAPVTATDYITAGNSANQREATYQAQQQQQQQQHFLWRPDSQTPTVIRG